MCVDSALTGPPFVRAFFCLTCWIASCYGFIPIT